MCSTKSAPGIAIITPVIPPSVNVTMKPIVHSTGAVNSMRPRYIVNSQLKIFTPVGIAITIVIIPKNAFTFAPEPIVKKWCSHTRNASTMITHDA
ncbi:hypothetical protein BG99_3095 [Burkholderia mallei]|nr:hypothetical protein BG99_3095 [Burkholderia mallei]KGD38966.1 hypothetical protein DP44_2271 [Burkholderia pseudomallei]